MPSKGGASSSSSAPALKTLFYNDDYGLDNATATAVSAHLASQGCTRPAHLCDVDDDVAEMAATLGLLKYPLKRLARIIKAARETGSSSAEHGYLNSPGPGLKRQREQDVEQRASAEEEQPVRNIYQIKCANLLHIAHSGCLPCPAFAST